MPGVASAQEIKAQLLYDAEAGLGQVMLDGDTTKGFPAGRLELVFWLSVSSVEGPQRPQRVVLAVTA